MSVFFVNTIEIRLVCPTSTLKNTAKRRKTHGCSGYSGRKSVHFARSKNGPPGLYLCIMYTTLISSLHLSTLFVPCKSVSFTGSKGGSGGGSVVSGASGSVASAEGSAGSAGSAGSSEEHLSKALKKCRAKDTSFLKS